MRQDATEVRDAAMCNSELSSDEKRAVQTQHIYDHGRALFMCRQCWLAPGFCTCGRMERVKPETTVIVHVHHNEWCATACLRSCIRVLSFGPCRF
jgi:DTW domain-containing protein YfiP